MRILLCHNHYQQPGGEDRTFLDEARLLETRGHEVIRYTVHNDTIDEMSRWRLARQTLWNREGYDALRTLIQARRPHVMHCTNTFPLISPSAYYAARREQVPVVQSLHNYRTLCPNALLLRKGSACEKCLGRSFPWPAIVHACYRESRSASLAVAGMLGLHRIMGTWKDAVDLYLTLTDFAREKFIEGGFPAEKMVVKPNFVYSDTGPGSGEGGYVVFVGRLSDEKGIDVLLSAWSMIKAPVVLKIVGDGPLAPQVARAQARDSRVHWLGHRSHDEVDALIGGAFCLVMPSLCYETFGRTIIEAYTRGTPVIASRLGAMRELVKEGRTGLMFEPGNASDLADRLRFLLGSQLIQKTMREDARTEFEQKFTADINYQALMTLYERVLDSRAQQEAAPTQPDMLHAINES